MLASGRPTSTWSRRPGHDPGGRSRDRGWRPRAGLLAAVAVAVVAGCGDPAGPSRPPAAEPTPASTSAAPPERRDDLAESAEEEASRAHEGPGPRRPVFRGPVLGGDISWPQCPRGMGIPERRTLGAPMPLTEARYVVVGLTNGPGFSANPCLADQVDWARRHRLLTAAYAVASYPDARHGARHGTDGPFDGEHPPRRTRQHRLPAGPVQRRLDGRRRAAIPDRLDRRGAGAGLRVERRPGGERGGGPRRGPRLHRRRLPDRGLLHAVTSGSRSSTTSRSACRSGGPRGRRRGPRRRGAAATTGRSRAATAGARAVAGGRAGPQRHLPGGPP